MNDEELLKAYVGSGSQDAFAELVQRHVGLVYATALRQLREPGAAQDVTQQTFCALAQKAATLRDPRRVAAWLHRTSRQLSALHCRTEQRRSLREQAVAMNLSAAEDDRRWEDLEPLLDQALEGLGDSDRTALLLRFFEGRPMADVADALGVSEAAAKMRIGRAVEKLRGVFVRHGIACSAAGLLLLFHRHAHASAPEGLIPAVLAATRGSIPFQPTAPAGWLGWSRRLFWPLAGAAMLLVGAWGISSKLRPSSEVEPPTPDSSLSQADPASDPQAGDPAPPAPNPAAQIEFTVVDDETGDALAGVQIRVAELVGSMPRVEVTTDASGRFVIPRPTATGDFHFRVIARHEGYASRRISWSRFQRDDLSDIPAEYVIRLQRGIQIGGVVRNPTGSPIPGATVTVSGDMFKLGAPPRDYALLLDGGRETTTTDNQGRWNLSIPLSEVSPLSFSFRSPGFIEAIIVTDTSDRRLAGAVRLPSAELLPEIAMVTLKTGHRVAGCITDTQGNPISGAQIVQNRQWDDDFRRTVSAADGTFEFRNLREGTLTLMVQAPGFAATSVEAQVPAPSDLWVEMRPGRIVRGRIVDQDHQGIARVDVELKVGPGYRPEFQMELKTDSEGRFAWDQAPGDSLTVTLFKSGYPQKDTSLPADGTETLVTLEKADPLQPVRVVGRVVDDQTGAPIERFRVVVGEHEIGVISGDRAVKSGENGAFALSLYESKTSIEVRATGYQPARQDLSVGTTGEIALDFRLVPAEGWSGVVILPDGQPASGAEVALVSHNKMATLERGRFLDRDFANVTSTDLDGTFHFEPEPPEIPIGRMLVAVHAQGYAEHDADRWSPGTILRLQPWGRVQGVVQNRSTYPAQLKVYLVARFWSPWLELHLGLDSSSAVPDDRGEFVLEYVPPGNYSVGLIPWRTGVIDKRITFQVLPGKTSRIEVRDDGLTVAGQLAAPDLPPDFDFTHSTAVLVRRQSRPVDLPRLRSKDFPNAAAYEQASREHAPKLIAYWQSAEGLSAWMEERKYGLVLNPDGSFAGRAIPPGDYDLQVMARSAPPGQPMAGGITKFLNSLEPVRIEPAVGAAGTEPVALGPIPLGKRF
ncbi:MAG: sigma-70 family RNA polymerase sigma factor [Verrucomicrobiae bacterium]|nr:sigma-70 family RNA polymerase sigma factor [Verrucomicrobiae bacterium]